MKILFSFFQDSLIKRVEISVDVEYLLYRFFLHRVDKIVYSIGSKYAMYLALVLFPMKGFLSHVLSGRNLFRSEIEWFRSNDRLWSNVFHRLAVHTFAVSTVTTALLTNTQARNAIGRQTFSADLYNREQIYSISDRIWDQTERQGEKKEKKKHGEKGTKKCRRQSYKHQNHCPVYSYFSSNLCVYW